MFLKKKYKYHMHFKVTVIQIEKTLMNDRQRVSKVS